MTHFDVTVDNRNGIPVAGCGRELELMGSYPDQRIGFGGPIVSTIYVYRCPYCEMRISIDRVHVEHDAISLHWELLNSYKLPKLDPAARPWRAAPPRTSSAKADA